MNEVPWALATSVDFLYPETGGGQPSWMSRLTSGYMANLTKLSMEDPFVHLIFTQVLHLLKPPSVLFHPRIASAVFRYSTKRRASDTDSARNAKADNLNRMTEDYR